MFGYIKPFTPELKIREDGVYKAHYCGVCKAIGRYSQCFRLGLQYDCAFLSLLLGSISGAEYTTERCVTHWVNKRNIARGQAVDYAAAVNTLLIYHKLRDDWHDDRNILKGTLTIAASPVNRRMMRDFETLSASIRDSLASLRQLEVKKCDSPDETAECFGRLLESVIVCAPIETLSVDKTQLRTIFFNIGRWLYLIDALDDYRKDVKKRQYNVLTLKYPDAATAANAMKPSLEFTLAQAAEAYECIENIHNKGLLDNFFYGGLPDMTAKILKETLHEPV